MIEKFKRVKSASIQDRVTPKTVEDLMQRFDLGNIGIIEYLDSVIDKINKSIDISEVPLVIDNLNSTSPINALSTNMGKFLNDKINNKKCTTLFSGTSGNATALEQDVIVNLSDNPLNYDVIYVTIGSGGNDTTVVSIITSHLYTAYSMWALPTWYMIGHISIASPNTLSFKVRAVGGYLVTNTKVFRVVGIKF